MSKIRLVEIHEETSQEKALREWFDQQVLTSPETLEAAARTILGLVTGLIGLLFGALTISADNLPVYMNYSLVRGLGVVAVVALLTALAGALEVLLPRAIRVSRARPDEQAATFQEILDRKARWLTVAVIAFGVGLAALGLVLVIALLRAT